MNLNENNVIYGVPQGIYYGQNERVDEINERIYGRNRSDYPLRPNFNPRPVPTKYSLFPIINRRAESSVPIYEYPEHSVETNFSPATRKGPPQGYLTNVDIETILRNQTVAIQHGADQGTYIPSSDSELYKVSVVSSPSIQPYPNLFYQPNLYTNIPSSLVNSSIGKKNFFNHTRTQLRNETV
jgi:hypothetical protein